MSSPGVVGLSSVCKATVSRAAGVAVQVKSPLVGPKPKSAGRRLGGRADQRPSR